MLIHCRGRGDYRSEMEHYFRTAEDRAVSMNEAGHIWEISILLQTGSSCLKSMPGFSCSQLSSSFSELRLLVLTDFEHCKPGETAF